MHPITSVVSGHAHVAATVVMGVGGGGGGGGVTDHGYVG